MHDPLTKDTLQKLDSLNQKTGDLKSQLAIIRISEPITSNTDLVDSSSPSKRASDVSALDDLTPASLEADLTHYKVPPTTSILIVHRNEIRFS